LERNWLTPALVAAHRPARQGRQHRLPEQAAACRAKAEQLRAKDGL
jgi:hypothetical protein